MYKNRKGIAEHKRRNREMFDAIAQRYDVLNHLLSGGIDIYWRRRALNSLQLSSEPRILDLATGTADFALAARRLNPKSIIGVDVALEMLRLGVRKVEERSAPAALMGGDAEHLPFQDASFDVVMGAFGVRNFGNIPSGLAEAYRVLRPGGQVLVLDFCEPATPLFRQLYQFYFHNILPLIGGFLSGQRQAYAYLPNSVGTFPQRGAFVRLLEDAGFVEASATTLTMGICCIYQGSKPVS